MSDSTQNPPEGSFPPPPPPEGQQSTPGTPPPAPGTPPPAPAPPSEPGYGYGSPAPAVGQPADLLMRFLARLIDFILLGIVNSIIALIIVAGAFGLSGGNTYGFGPRLSYGATALSAVIASVLYLGYFTLMESGNGRTIGKMLLKLQTQGPDGSTPTREQALKRNFWVALGILGVIPVVGGVIGSVAELAIVILIAVTIHRSPIREGWHDKLAGGTRVVKTG
jgi:uncharacterized RDD family membrane protein YckC